MLKTILNKQSLFKVPNHVVIVLDGDGEHYNNSQQSCHFLKLIQTIQYFDIPIVSLVLVSQTSLSLPSVNLTKQLKQILFTLRKLEKKIDAQVRIIGDLQLCPDKQIALEIQETCQQNTGTQIVQLFLFYSSLNSIFKQNFQNLEPPDLFLRTSGEHRLGDILLYEISKHPCYIYQKPFDLSRISYFTMYKLLTCWQLFSERRKNLMQKDTTRFLFSKQFKNLSNNFIRDDEFTREESGFDSQQENAAYFNY
ncbi:Di-trans,poly-cis-decaprenylcistransferase [Spironucleus salmonicida]|uniref:Di-trans,poly-cis-decaprenylcistransferase n=1 Tax=Spironucleus salmonicida TaxID=348837 RepID=V6LDU8_9EUKA|nr:Di-trans,poly-cis-decaprenylcistransferase [Spironucleus salmonicida]|eukprot:EST42665.1 Di-trans,poly-cis-decaprenylcistransferase [Spironucleus salmonicida]